MRENKLFRLPTIVFLTAIFCPFFLAHSERLKLGDVSAPTEKEGEEKKTKTKEKLKPTPEDHKEMIDTMVAQNYRRGVELIRKERFKEAKGYFDRALVLSPHHEPSLTQLRIIKRHLAAVQKPPPVAAPPAGRKSLKSLSPEPVSKPVVKKKEKITPKPAVSDEEAKTRSSALYLEALTATQNGKFDEAYELCRQALELDPNNLQAERMHERLESRRNGK